MLEGRQFFVTEFSRGILPCPAHVIVETYSRECNMYFKAIGQRPGALIHMVLEGQPGFRVWARPRWLILLLKRTPRKIVCIPEPLDVSNSPRSNGYSRAGSFSQLSFQGWALPAQLILLLKCTLRNIMCILKPSD